MIPVFRQPVPHPDGDVPQSGGVTIEAKPLHQPKASLCLMLAFLWIFPSLGAAFILGASDANWLRADGTLDRLRAIAFEQWIAVIILMAHPVFVWLAWRFRRTEPWKEIKPEPHHDLQDPP